MPAAESLQRDEAWDRAPPEQITAIILVLGWAASVDRGGDGGVLLAGQPQGSYRYHPRANATC